MDSLRYNFRVPYRESEVRIGTNSAVLEQSFVAKSLRRHADKDDGLRASRGTVNAVVISLAIWIAMGVAVFALI
ncbi:MAG: hypothetical protein ACR2QX_05140 [Woeseiaceae bacterium]